MKIEKLLKEIEIIDSIHSHKEIDIQGIAYHTKDVKPGTLFVALKGAVTDGHKYIPIAVEKGAVALLVEDLSPLPIAQYQVKSTRKSLADVSAAFYDYPAKKLTTIGVTATNGKTTTCYMLEKIFQEAGKKTGVIGSIGIRYLGNKIPSYLTTPESLEIQKYLNTMLNEGVEVVMIESSSSGLESHRLDQLYYDGVTYHNLALDHMDRHGTFENYAKIKGSLLTQVATKDTVAVIETDNPDIAVVKNNTKAKVFGMSFKSTEDFYITDVVIKENASTFVLHTPQGKSIPLKTDVPGGFNVTNGAMAAALAITMGCTEEVVQKGLANYKGSQRRFEKIYDDVFTVFDDYCHNENNLAASLDSLAQMNPSGGVHIVYGIRGNRGVDINRDNAILLADRVKKLNPTSFIASKSSDVVGENDIVDVSEEKVFLDVMKEHHIPYQLYENLTDALHDLLDVVKEGDVILLLGAQSMDEGGSILLKEFIKRKPSDIAKKSLEQLKERI